MRYSLPKLKWKKMFLSKVQYDFDGIESLKAHSDLFGSAKRICIYAGELYFDFYENEDFLNNLRKSLELGCVIKAIFGPAVYVDDVAFLKMACKSEGVQLYKHRYRDPAHFKMIEDRKGQVFAIVDRPHDIDADDEARTGGILLVKGWEAKIEALEAKFGRELKRSKPISIKNIIEEFSNRGQKGNEFYGFITQKNGKVAPAEDEQIKKLKKELLNCLPE